MLYLDTNFCREGVISGSSLDWEKGAGPNLPLLLSYCFCYTIHTFLEIYSNGVGGPFALHQYRGLLILNRSNAAQLPGIRELG